MAIVKTDDKYYIAIAEKIREKTGTSATYTPSEMPSGIDAAFSEGKTLGYETAFAEIPNAEEVEF